MSFSQTSFDVMSKIRNSGSACNVGGGFFKRSSTFVHKMDSTPITARSTSLGPTKFKVSLFTFIFSLSFLLISQTNLPFCLARNTVQKFVRAFSKSFALSIRVASSTKVWWYATSSVPRYKLASSCSAVTLPNFVASWK